MSFSSLQLTTSRLRLAPMTDDDVAALVRHWGNDQVRHYLWDDQPVTLDMVNAVVTTSNHDFQRDAYGLWTAKLADNEAGEARLIGMCGLRQLQGTQWLEVLYSLRPRYWRRGLATEAAQAVLGYAFNSLERDRVVASAGADNVASAAVLKRLGLSPFAIAGRKDRRAYWSINQQQFRDTFEPGTSFPDSQRGVHV